MSSTLESTSPEAGIHSLSMRQFGGCLINQSESAASIQEQSIQEHRAQRTLEASIQEQTQRDLKYTKIQRGQMLNLCLQMLGGEMRLRPLHRGCNLWVKNYAFT
jgi:hypothetical protein